MLTLAAHAAPLIMEAEARLPDARIAEVRTRAITRGPSIKVVAPDPAAALKSPFDLKVAFEARGGASIDLGSVRVVYLKAPSVDLLERVRPGLSARGIELIGAEAPAGEHHIRISLQDSDGRSSQAVIKLNVAE